MSDTLNTLDNTTDNKSQSINLEMNRDDLQNFVRNGTPEEVLDFYASLPKVAIASDFGPLDNNLVVVDTEATGLSFKNDDLIQIAAAKISEGKVSDWYITFVNPGIEISEDIEHLTHISNEDVADAPTPQEAVAGLVEFVGDSCLLAHNESFDRQMLTKHMQGAPLLDNIWIDSLDLARIVLPRFNTHRLIDLSDIFPMPQSTHRADDDVASTALLYRYLLAGIKQMPRELVWAIARLADVDAWPTSYVFEQMALMMDPEKAHLANINSLITDMRKHNVLSLPQQVKLSCQHKNSPFEEDMDDSFVALSDMRLPNDEALKVNYSPDGLMGKIYPDYEEREEQSTMAAKINEAFRNCDNLVIEAGTGVGKSMAYLIPAIELAKRNKLIVGVATKTNALLDQLIYHELPALKEQIPSLVYSALKGSNHYLCLRKVQSLTSRGAKNVEFKGETFNTAPSIAGLLTYVWQTTYDDCDNIKINGRALYKPQYTSPSYECLKRKCPYYNNGCFVHGARKMAENSDIVVTNHSLLLCNIQAEGALLPNIKFWIVDEAHGLDKEARDILSYELDAYRLGKISSKLSSTSVKKNPFEKVKKFADTGELKEGVSTENVESLLKELESEDKSTEGNQLLYASVSSVLSKAPALAQASDFLVANMKPLLSLSSNKQNRGYEFQDIWINGGVRETEEFNNLWKIAEEFYDNGQAVLNSCQKLITVLENYKATGTLQGEIAMFVFELKELLVACDAIFFNNTDEFVYFAHLSNREYTGADKLVAQLYDVGECLSEGLFEMSNSIVLASATLAINGKFNKFMNNVGLSDENSSSYLLDSSFDYDNSMTIYVASDMPAPNDPAYLEALQKFLVDLHIAQNGSMLNLFTNRKKMESTYEYVREHLKPHELDVLCQKWKVSTKMINDEFLANKSVSLFALKSFWEGFDAPGDTLKSVMIAQLPFPIPTGPLSEERRKRDRGFWSKYVLPETVIETKQAVGRLIRKSTDKGNIIFADSKLADQTKWYRFDFLNSLPSKNIKVLTMDGIIEDISESNN